LNPVNLPNAVNASNLSEVVEFFLVTVDLVLDVKAQLGEGPIWDTARKRLIFVDIMRGEVHEFDPVTGTDRAIHLPEPVGSVVPSRRGDWIVATQTGFARLDPKSGAVHRIVSVEADMPDTRMNDGAIDPRGRFWAGTMSMTGRRHGSLYRLDEDGRVARMLTGVTVSNGIGWSPDGSLMYYVDTQTGRIDIFDFDEAWGTIMNRRTFATVSHLAGHPDGLVVDAEGGIWIALWAGGAIHHYTPDGKLEQKIKLPVTHPTKCAFGGADWGDLYITSAWIELTPAEREKQPLAGGLFACRPGVKGQPTRVFTG
jgi:sugar lactone lactonase YvrE